MYQPIPGYTHLKVYKAPDPIRYSRPRTTAEISARHQVHGLVVTAIEVAAGMRPLAHISKARYDPIIRVHLLAWIRGHDTHRKPRPCHVTSLHARTDGEFFGTAHIGSRRHAFTGNAKEGAFVGSFRLM